MAFWEGISFLVLLGIAMPLKYIWHMPQYVRAVGTAHGILFVLYVLYTFVVAKKHNWKFEESTWKVLLASILPFGTFWVDDKILKHIKEE